MSTIVKKSRDVRRREIALAALRLVGKSGLTHLTTNTLAGAVGFTTGALFRHFSTIDEILTEMTRQAVDLIEATFPDPALSARERLFTMLQRRFKLLSREPGLAWLLLTHQARVSLPLEAVDILTETATQSRSILCNALAAGQQQGQFRSDIPVESLATIVTGTLHSLVNAANIHRLASDPPPPATQILKSLEILLLPLPPQRPLSKGVLS